jgi:hypothetical protein
MVLILAAVSAFSSHPAPGRGWPRAGRVSTAQHYNRLPRTRNYGGVGAGKGDLRGDVIRRQGHARNTLNIWFPPRCNS